MTKNERKAKAEIFMEDHYSEKIKKDRLGSPVIKMFNDILYVSYEDYSSSILFTDPQDHVFKVFKEGTDF